MSNVLAQTKKMKMESNACSWLAISLNYAQDKLKIANKIIGLSTIISIDICLKLARIIANFFKLVYAFCNMHDVAIGKIM